MRPCLSFFAVFALACPLAVLVSPRVASAAPDCATIRAHVARAQAALIEADSYVSEANTAAGIAEGRRAYHELDVADRYGNPAACYAGPAYLEYAAALVHATAYDVPFLSFDDLRHADDKIQEILRINPAAARKINPVAYASMVKWAKVVHRGRLDMARAQDRTVRDEAAAPPDRRAQLAADAFARCRAAKASQAAEVVDAPVTGDIRLGDVGYYTATLDVDERGRADNVQIIRTLSRWNAPVPEGSLKFLLENANYVPAIAYAKGTCRAVRSTIVVESGKLSRGAAVDEKG